VTTAVVAAPVRDRLATWCGLVLIGGAALVPLLIWIAPMGFAALLALIGLLCLPAARMDDADRPAALILFAALIWAAVSTTWSPYHPTKAGNSTILKLALQLPLYWCAVCGARRAAPDLQRRALAALAWGLAILGLVMIAETLTAGSIYKWLHDEFYEPIRGDLAEANLGHSTFVMALLWPLAAVGAPARARGWLTLAIVAGTVSAAVEFSSDAPVLSMALGPLVGLAIWRWPMRGPRVFAGIAAAFFLLAPLIVGAVRASGDYSGIQHAIPQSWSSRMGYWSHAIDWIAEKPLLGWGLDASRMFSPGIVLHPHDGALQIWLELGLIGAVAAAVFWGLTLVRLVRTRPSVLTAAVGASTAVYLLFGALNFGVWQEWWLALGAVVAVLAAMLEGQGRDDGDIAHPST